MKMTKTGKVATALLMVALLSFFHATAQKGMPAEIPDSTLHHSPRKVIHRAGVEVRPAWVVGDGLRGVRYGIWSPEGKAFSTHLKYSFQFHPNTLAGRTYAGAYQGVGVSWNAFEESAVLGAPMSFYLFQGAHIARISPRWSFDYEWNFGLSAPWNQFDQNKNNVNWVIGSKVNAYINTSFFFNYMISPQLSAAAGLTLTHFSNGNTKFPNAGLNAIGANIGLTYNFNRDKDTFLPRGYRSGIPRFPRHMSYDVVFFGSWRKRGLLINDEPHILPDAYPVLGFSIAPMYNFNHNLRIGAAVDGFWDSSANLILEDYVIDADGSGQTELQLSNPGFKRQIALGLSGRVEFAMPYFTIGLGVGANVLHRGGDMKSVYQILSLKVELLRNSFVHIGYSLHNFREPNFLMLGLGFRLNNKSPELYR